MAVQHKDITDPDIHEPKGISSAAAGEIYVANGSGSGEWKDLAASGDMGIDNNSTTRTLSLTAATDATLNTDGDYTKLNASGMWQEVYADDFTIDTTNGDLIVPVAGIYRLDFWISHSVDGSTNALVGFKYVINDTTFPARKITSSSDYSGEVRTTSASGVTNNFSAGDTVSIYVACDDTRTLTIYDAGFNMTLVKEE